MQFRFIWSSICVLTLAAHSTANASYNLSVSGVASQPLSPSADTITLNANSITASVGAFTLQTGTFSVGDSGSLNGAFPYNTLQTIKVNGEAASLGLMGTLYVTDPTRQNEDFLNIGGPPIIFAKSGVLITPNVSATASGGVEASLPINVTATLSTFSGPAPLKKDQQLFTYAGLALGALAIGVDTCAIAEPCGAILLAGGATAVDLGIIKSTVGAGGLSLEALGVDPVDFNYKAIAVPAPPNPPTLSSAIQPTLKNIVDYTADSSVVIDAMITTFNRAEGAYYSGDQSFVDLQLNTFTQYEKRLQTDLLGIGQNGLSVASSLGAEYSQILEEPSQNLISAATAFSVPEPSTYALFTLGFAVLILNRSRGFA